jgi:hypothetical protein
LIHPFTPVALSHLTAAAAPEGSSPTRFSSCQAFLQRSGFTREDEHLHYCSPYGEWSTAYLEAAKDSGVVLFRGVGIADSTLPSSNSTADQGVPDVSSPASIVPQYVFHSVGVSNAWTADQINAYVDHCIYGGRSLIILFHSIESPADSSIKTTPTIFAEVADHLYRKKGLIDLVTLPQLRRNHLRIS